MMSWLFPRGFFALYLSVSDASGLAWERDLLALAGWEVDFDAFWLRDDGVFFIVRGVRSISGFTMVVISGVVSRGWLPGLDSSGVR
jgi:hypothetical protein